MRRGRGRPRGGSLKRSYEDDSLEVGEDATSQRTNNSEDEMPHLYSSDEDEATQRGAGISETSEETTDDSEDDSLAVALEAQRSYLATRDKSFGSSAKERRIAQCSAAKARTRRRRPTRDDSPVEPKCPEEELLTREKL